MSKNVHVSNFFWHQNIVLLCHKNVLSIWFFGFLINTFLLGKWLGFSRHQGNSSLKGKWFLHRVTTEHNGVIAQIYLDFKYHLVADWNFMLNEILRAEIYRKYSLPLTANLLIFTQICVIFSGNIVRVYAYSDETAQNLQDTS